MSKINNHVTRVSDKDLDAFLAGDKPKAILFTQKGTTSALIRSIAIDFLDVISVAQIRDKEAGAVKKFGIEKFPALVLIPGEGKDPIVYDGEMAKKDMVKFLTQAGQPNPVHASGNTKSTKAEKDDTKSAKKNKSTEAAKEPAAESKESTAEAVPSIVPISTINSLEKLTEKCLAPKSHTCVLLFTPGEAGEKAVDSLSHLNTKYVHGGRNTFPFIAVPSDSDAASTLPKALGLNNKVNLIAINTRRNWWRQYEGDFSLSSVESWIDAIRMGEGAKKKLPEGAIVEKKAESSQEKSTQATDPEPEIETDGPDDVKTVIETEIETEYATVTGADGEETQTVIETEIEYETQTETEHAEGTAEPEAQPVAESEAEPKTKDEIKHEEL
jgi:protein disulfide-isomerase A6